MRGVIEMVLITFGAAVVDPESGFTGGRDTVETWVVGPERLNAAGSMSGIVSTTGRVAQRGWMLGPLSRAQ
jgi:hypothetical protein